ncbi:MAG TPA: transketolase [Patescibacteria group bacterium]|nr:transketolase [Patescibacteria group bacterium]
MIPSQLQNLARLVRYYILKSTTAAGSGHPTSSLSATDLMTTLMFGGFFHADLDHPENPTNDRLIFSKGHASPLLYSLYAAAGKVSEEELMQLRKFDSPLEGHPTMRFRYTEAATGSLGQGLSIGVGMALNAKLDKLPYKTFVLLGDGEMFEGSNYEAIQIAAHYKLDNLIGILDVSGLEQAGESVRWKNAKEHGAKDFVKILSSFGWQTILVNGHSMKEIAAAYKKALKVKGKPVMIVAKTVKGKGVSFLEGKNHWHGKTLSAEECERALEQLGKIDTQLRGEVAQPARTKIFNFQFSISNQFSNFKSELSYSLGEAVAPRKAYGSALVRIMGRFPNMVVLDAGVSNSTHAETFKKTFPQRFFEMYIGEQNMVGAALGLSRRGKIPFVSTFGAFFTRAFDQIRMSQYSNANIKFVGSHVGVSIGPDGSSQMGLEDIAMFRAVQNCAVLYPCDAVSAERLVEEAARHEGNVYLRMTREDTLVIYPSDETFPIGGSKILHASKEDVATVVAAGITVYEALQAYKLLLKEGIKIRVIDLYSIRPIDVATLEKAARETGTIITVEDHYAEGGMGEAVASAIEDVRLKIKDLSDVIVERLAVRKMPRSGKPEELLAYEEIDAEAIVKAVKQIVK